MTLAAARRRGEEPMQESIVLLTCSACFARVFFKSVTAAVDFGDGCALSSSLRLARECAAWRRAGLVRAAAGIVLGRHPREETPLLYAARLGRALLVLRSGNLRRRRAQGSQLAHRRLAPSLRVLRSGKR